VLFQVLLLAPFAVAAGLALRHPFALLAVAPAALAVAPLRRVREGAVGRDLIAVLQDTGRVQLAYGLLLGLGLAL
jgi:1,4-dihydroxy-2-naphthoate octaprenyltransferase